MRDTRLRTALFGCALALVSCATPVATPPPQPPVAIDLSPRCEPSIEELEAGAPLPAPRDPRTDVASLPRGARWLSLVHPAAPLESLAWGFPVRGAHAELGAALLREMETSTDPRGLREQTLALGARASTSVEGDWLWLELRYPALRRAAALQVFARWLEIAVPEPDPYERIRRGASIVALAEQASPTHQVERLFETLHSGTRAPSHEAVEAPTPDAVSASLRATLQPRGSAVIHVASDPAESARSVRDAIASWIEAWPAARAAAQAKEASDGDRRVEAFDAGTIHVVDRPAAPQVELLVGFPSVGPDPLDASGLRMLASLLGSDVGGRLFRDLRERQGLAYIINAFHRDERFVVTTRSRPERATALLAGIESHLRALVDVPLRSCEVAMLVDRMTGEAALLGDDPMKLASQWRRSLARGSSIESLSESVAAHRAAAARGLDAIARRHLEGAPTVVLVGDATRLRADLAAAFPERPVRVYDASLERSR